MLLHGVTLGIARADEHTKKDARNIRVENGRPLPECEASNRTRRISTDPFERQQRVFIVRQLAVVACDGLSRDRLQPLRPDVVAKWTPRSRDVRLVRNRQCVKRGKFLEPLGVLGQHTVDLRLLQHDLGHQNVIRVVSAAPRQIASVTAVPREQALTEAATIWRGRQRKRSGPTARLGHLV